MAGVQAFAPRPALPQRARRPLSQSVSRQDGGSPYGGPRGEQPLNGAMAVFGKNLTFYPQCILKMAWFKGKDKTTFLDNRLVTGNIIELQSEAMAFCFKHLNLSGVVKGLYREEELEIPVEALREAIINALAHRLYSSNGGVSLAIFEDRVEISNPGNFSFDAASQRVEPGMASNPRNPLIARVLYLRKAIEMWGRGIGLIINACEKAHLAPPRIYEDRGFVYIVFTRPTKQEWNAKVQGGVQVETDNDGTGLKTRLKTGLKTGLKGNPDTVDETLRQMIKDNPAITIPMMSEATRLSRNGVLYHLQALKEKFGLTRVGGRKSGHWEFLK
jgi:ATP-dependent DNA helicase RecG